MTKGSPSAVAKRKWIVVAAVAVPIAAAAWLLWPGIAARRRANALREEAHVAFLHSDWQHALGSLQEAAILRPTDADCQRDFADMQEKWYAFVEESLKARKLPEAYAFLHAAENDAVAGRLTEPVRTKYANLVAQAHDAALTALQTAIGEAAQAHAAEAYAHAHAALDAVAPLADLTRDEFDKATGDLIKREWKERIGAAQDVPLDATMAVPFGARTKRRNAIVANLRQLLRELGAQHYPAAAAADVQHDIESAIDHWTVDFWQDDMQMYLARDGNEFTFSAAMSGLKAIRARLAEDSEISPAARTEVEHAVSIAEYEARAKRARQLESDLEARLDAGDFDGAQVIQRSGAELAAVAAAADGGELAAKSGLDADLAPYTQADHWTKLHERILQRTAAAQVQALIAAVRQRDGEKTQAVIDRLGHIYGASLDVKGSDLAAETDFARFQADLVALRLAPAQESARQQFDDIVILDALQDRFPQPETVKAFVAAGYSEWTRRLIDTRPGLALYTLGLAERTSGRAYGALRAYAIKHFVDRYPITITAGKLVSADPVAFKSLDSDWERLVQVLTDATAGWTHWTREPEAKSTVSLVAQVGFRAETRTEASIDRNIRYQSGTHQAPNPDYANAQNDLNDAQRSYNETANAAQAGNQVASQLGGVYGAVAPAINNAALEESRNRLNAARNRLATTPPYITVADYADRPERTVEDAYTLPAEFDIFVPGTKADGGELRTGVGARVTFGVLATNRAGAPANGRMPTNPEVFASVERQFHAQLAAQGDTLRYTIAAMLESKLARRAPADAANAADYDWGRAALWQQADLHLNFDSAETAARRVLGLPPVERLLAAPPTDPSTLIGYGRQNSLGMQLLPVPGTHVMFAECETRVKDFEQFVKDANYQVTGTALSIDGSGWVQNGATWQNPGFKQTPYDPVVCIPIAAARAFCHWLTEKERKAGLITAKQEYRLPTDAEWSCAAGLGDEGGGTPEEKGQRTGRTFAWGQDWPPPLSAGNYAGPEMAVADGPNWPALDRDDGYARTAPVGRYGYNGYGLCDVGGNVQEFCEDAFNATGIGLTRDAFFTQSKDAELSLASRTAVKADLAFSGLGFRVVLTE